MSTPGRIVILNGAPRSGKTSIARTMQHHLDGIWINLGVDAYQQMVPERLRPSIGLRPGGERPDLEPHLPLLFAALYESVAAHSRLGLNVVVDIGHHDAYSRPLHILPDCARRLAGLPVLLVGVHCPLATIMQRRAQPEPSREAVYLQSGADGDVPAPVIAWQREVHLPGLYDLELDTSILSPEECAHQVGLALHQEPKTPRAIDRIACSPTPSTLD